MGSSQCVPGWREDGESCCSGKRRGWALRGSGQLEVDRKSVMVMWTADLLMFIFNDRYGSPRHIRALGQTNTHRYKVTCIDYTLESVNPIYWYSTQWPGPLDLGEDGTQVMVCSAQYADPISALSPRAHVVCSA